MIDALDRHLKMVDKEPPPSGSILALGVFDGVHRGHQQLLNRATGAVSFWPHPQNLFTPSNPVQLLSTPGEQGAIIYSLGLKYFGFFHFTKEFASLSAERFVKDVLSAQLQVAGVVIGFNFRFGANNSGDYNTMLDAGKRYGFNVEVVPPVYSGGKVISSTRVRHLIQEGLISEAAQLLGRPYFLTGHVVHGEGRGHGLGFPTINLAFSSERLRPAPGVYAGSACVGDEVIPAAIFVGSRLTFADKEPTVEAYLLDWSADLYGATVRLDFTHRIREIIAFSSVRDLSDQIQRDVEKIRELSGK